MIGSRWIAIIGYICFGVFTITLLQTSISGYQPDIYTVFPVWGWIIFSVAILIGGLLLYIGVRSHNQRLQIHGFAIIAVSFAVFWFYAELLGLRFWAPQRADHLSHFGRAAEITDTGEIGSENLYPLLHILLADLELISGLPVERFGPLLSLVYYPLLMIGIILIVRRYTYTRIALFVGLAAIPIFYQKHAHHLKPWVVYFSLIPFLILLLHIYKDESDDIQQSYVGIGALILSFGIGIGHPMSGMMGAIVIGTIGFVNHIASSWLENNNTDLSLNSTLLIPLLIAFPIWYLSQSIFQQFLVGSILSLLRPGTQGGQSIERATESGYTTWQLVTEWLIGRWGTGLLILSIGAIVTTVILYRVLYRRATKEEFTIAAIYSVGIGLAITMLTVDLVVNAQVYRPNQVSIAAGIVLFGIALWWATDHATNRVGGILRVSLVLILLLSIVWTPFTIFGETQYLTEAELTGSEHHHDYRTEETVTYSQRTSQVMSQYLQREFRPTTWENRAFGREEDKIPKYLGYDHNSTINDSIEDDSYYLITKERDIKWYTQEPQNRYPYIEYYTEENIKQLHDDAAVHKTYANGEFSIWRSHT